ncbi:hypothetical protein P872_14065 [Rhodonellum psychrophilum GCM71 = DSM 17998]|uniref:Uncharacterized protein n=1 Tax=Rhodonellum psychrophilum GCM71 = DSM 17998 TaxID=1123057 RepID=U5BIJ0_9BACT|nr:hypothetical protein P872_14065 [Rhodonellum psychrophilum GCM71 = DSM 17998]
MECGNKTKFVDNLTKTGKFCSRISSYPRKGQIGEIPIPEPNSVRKENGALQKKSLTLK